MVFSSILFLFQFLPISLGLYYIVPRRFKNLVLLMCSLFFYAWGEPAYVILIIFSTLLDYIIGRIVGRYRENNKKVAILGVVVSAVLNLALLGFFKYGDFIIQNLGSIFHTSFKPLNLELPIGISFYTFQTMSYTIDVCRGNAPVQKNIINFGAYVSLFPQLIAGPIVRYETIAKQLDDRKESIELFSKGIFRFCVGLGKKVLIANQVGELWNQISNLQGENLTCASAWIGAVAFSLQIYFDFSGYSDMAIGLGQMFGFEFLENFAHPYESKSITEFWRRWHISLGTWFKEYVYIPLGGNKKGLFRQILNIVIVWILTGLWHGASWNFVLWGVYYGIILLIEKIVFYYCKRRKLSGKKRVHNLKFFFCNFFARCYTLMIVCFGWMIFSVNDMKNPVDYMNALLGRGVKFANRETGFFVCSYGLLLLVATIGSLSIINKVLLLLLPDGRKRTEFAQLIFIIFIFIASLAMLVNSSYNPFLYFRF